MACSRLRALTVRVAVGSPRHAAADMQGRGEGADAQTEGNILSLAAVCS